jgi:hypothetical protein
LGTIFVAFHKKVMKNISLKLLLLVTLLFAVSCSRNDDEKSTTLIFTPTESISTSETLTYRLGDFGDKNLTTILTQASNAEVSELRIHEITGEVYYFYQPKAGFIGQDFVRLRTETGPLGSPNSETVWQANITIEVSL